MKNLILALLMSATAFSANAEVNRVEEYNFKQTYKDFEIAQRWTDTGKFLQAYYKIDDWSFGTRRTFADSGNHENRLMIDKKLLSVYKFKVTTRLEYRDFRFKEDHFRHRFEFHFKHSLNPTVDFWAKISPRWSFTDDDVVFSSRDQMGLTFKYKNIRFGPFVDRSTQGSFGNHIATVVGTNFKINL